MIHTAAFGPSEYAETAAAGAKVIWSPLSNLLLYGKTTNVYDALAEGVLVSLGTDWTPSGSRTLLHELKVADVALRDPRVLGASRDEVPAFALAGKPLLLRLLAEAALDRQLVDMVTRNPALTLRWYDQVGSVEVGKAADLMMIRWPAEVPPSGVAPTVYRALIDADESDVELVLRSGEPLAGDVGTIAALKPGDYEVVSSAVGGFQKAIDATTTADAEPISQVTTALQTGLTALGGDHSPAAGGPGPPTNTYSYLKAHVSGGAAAALPDAVFRGLLASNVGTLPDGSLNLERMQLNPLLEDDDDFLAHELHGDLDPTTGLIADPTPPYRLYRGNLNQIGPAGNPLLGVP
jgi:Amidohydrolase family